MKEKMYNLILEIDHNVKPCVLTLGSELMNYVTIYNNTYIIEPNIQNIKQFKLFSEENMCITYQWLKEQNLIKYEERLMKYVLTNKCILKLNK